MIREHQVGFTVKVYSNTIRNYLVNTLRRKTVRYFPIVVLDTQPYMYLRSDQTMKTVLMYGELHLQLHFTSFIREQ